MTPRVTLEGDILLDLFVEVSALGAPQSVAGVTVPSFVSRKVTTRLRLRDGESNLLAGLVQQNDTNEVRGFPGAIRVPVLKQLFSGNNVTSQQTEIIILMTPHLVRTSEVTEADLKPLYIGSAGNLGVGGPPPLIAPPGVDAQPAPAAQTPPASPAGPVLRGPGGTVVAAPPGSSPVPGTVVVPPPAPPAAEPSAAPVNPPAPAPAAPPAATPPPNQAAATPQPPAAEPPIVSAGIGAAQVLISPPSAALRVGGGPYTIPLSISGATGVSALTLTLVFDSTKLRVRSVQEGSFMRAGGAAVSFAQQANGNRIDITLARGADTTGASGIGLLAAVLFDAVAPGAATLTLSGSATGPGGTAMGLQFQPVTVTIQQ